MRKDLLGRRFGRLVAIQYIPNARKNWKCQCDCGLEHFAESNALSSGNTKSCGCLNRDPSTKSSFKHGMYNSPEYAAYSAMKERCFSKTCKSYLYYGGRGITVCERWLGDEGFKHFLADVGLRPSQDLSLDRINNEGNYEPGNVRWTTWSEQMSNRRKDFGKPERSRQATKNYWNSLTAEQRKEEIKRRKLTRRKTYEPCNNT